MIGVSTLAGLAWFHPDDRRGRFSGFDPSVGNRAWLAQPVMLANEHRHAGNPVVCSSTVRWYQAELCKPLRVVLSVVERPPR